MQFSIEAQKFSYHIVTDRSQDSSSSFFFFHKYIPQIQCQLLQNPAFFYQLFNVTVMCGFIYEPYSVPLVYQSFPEPMPCCLNYQSFIIYLISTNVKPSALSFFRLNFLAILGPSHFHIHFRINMSISKKKKNCSNFY